MHKRAWKLGACALVAVAIGAAPLPAAQNETPLIDREVFFGNPDRAAPQISPDGTKLAWLAPSNGVMNVWVAPVSDPSAAKVVTTDKKRGIRNYFWAFTNNHILYLQDVGGDENFHAFKADLTTGEEKDLTPFDGTRAIIQGVSHKFPEEIVVGLNNRDKRFFDVHRVNIKTGESKLVFQNDSFAQVEVDDDYRIRFAIRMTPAGGNDISIVSEDGTVKPYDTVPFEDALTTDGIGFDKTGKKLYIQDSRGRDTGAVFVMDIDSKQKTLLAEDPRCDVGGAMIHPTEKTMQAVAFNYDRQRWKVLDEAIAGDFAYLKTVAEGDFSVTSRTLDDRKWIVTYVLDDGPVRYYAYDRPAKKATFLFTNRKSLEGLTLSKMHPAVIKSRDGLALVCYYTLPAWTDTDGDAKPSRPMPSVLLVHGGPWARDAWGFNGLHQWLANRGYAVLSVNYRGSTGFGKSFVNAGNMEWAAKMHDDLIDAVEWASTEGIIDKKNVAIMGGSYGGYATLVGLTFTPEYFRCGVDIVGPSNIVTLLNTIPPYWAPQVETFKKRVGDHTTEDGRAMLESRSPLTHVSKIVRPLLIGQGANDPRVKQSESDQIVAAMKAKNLPVTYVLFPDEGHGFAEPGNRLAFNAVAEAFLAQHLNGRYEPIGDDFKKSSIQVPSGSEHVPGLGEAIKK